MMKIIGMTLDCQLDPKSSNKLSFIAPGVVILALLIFCDLELPFSMCTPIRPQVEAGSDRHFLREALLITFDDEMRMLPFN